MKRLTVLVVLFLAVFASVCQANLLQNGSFENVNSYVDNGFGFMGLSAPGVIPGWTVGGAGVDWINTFWTPSNGNFSLDLNSDNPGSVSQSFPTTSGATYTLSFDLAGNPGGLPNNKSLDVLVTGWPTQSFTFNTANNSTTNMGWATRSFTFTASSGTTTLEFLSTTSNPGALNNNYGPALDKASVEQIGVGVPEPSLVYLLAAGLAGLVVTRRRMSA